MQLRNSLRELSARIAEQRDEVQTEEATKRTFVLPFLAALDYNVYDPTQVTWGLGIDGESPAGKNRRLYHLVRRQADHGDRVPAP